MNRLKKTYKIIFILILIIILLFNIPSYCSAFLVDQLLIESIVNDALEKDGYTKGTEEYNIQKEKFMKAVENGNKFKEQIKKEGGSFFEKIIAECIGGIAQAVFNFTTGDFSNVGFKDYDKLIFNKDVQNESLSPFTDELWAKIMQWYSAFAIMAGVLILIAIIILSFKMFSAGINTARRNDVKDSMFRLLFGALAIALAPLFIRVLIFLNNSLVNMLVGSATGSLEECLGNNMISNIQTGNPIATALVIALFVYLFVKLNIKFIIRQFTLIVFTIFTPIAAGLWVINRNTTAVAIWAGQIFINIFMQFIYCFLFMIYLAFLPSTGGWAISIIWAMMILPLADTIQNCLQNLTSRIAGIDNEQIASRGIGMGAAIGYGLSALAQQFKTPEINKIGNNNNTGNNNSNGFLGRIKNVVNPPMNLSSEKDYNGNTNPIRNVIPNSDKSKVDNITNNSNIRNKVSSVANTAKSVIGTTAKVGASYLKVGAMMAGDNQIVQNHYTSKNTKSMNTTEHINNMQMEYKEGGEDEKET